MWKAVSRNVNRSCVVIVATAGLGAVPIATADPAVSTSPGVPCVEIVQQLAASPPDIGPPLQDAAIAVAAPMVDTAAEAPVEAAPLVEEAAVVPAAGGAPALSAVSVVAAPLAGGVPPLPPIPVIPDIASLGSLAPSQVSLPTVPGLPVQLPSEISLPHDLICEGTAWSAHPNSGAEPGSVPAARRNRGGW
jgi:hypothetical protein